MIDDRQDTPGGGAQFTESLSGLLRFAAIPYGYTLTIWAAGALLIATVGHPDVAELIAFVAGATGAFIVLTLISRTGRRTATPSTPALTFTGASHAIGVGLSLLVALALTPLGRSAWFFVPFAATATFMLVSAADLYLYARFHSSSAERGERDSEPR